jgi:hypothetical protein
MSATTRPTAPLPQAASVAIGRLGVRLALPGPVAGAVLSYRSAAARAVLLMDLVTAEYALSPLEWDDLAHAEDLMAGAKANLANVGRLDLIEVPPSPDIQRAVVRYGIAVETLAELESIRISTPVQFRQLADAQNTIKESRTTLAAAGLLHLIASDDHAKTKDALPQRPRGPHPQTAGA